MTSARCTVTLAILALCLTTDSLAQDKHASAQGSKTDKLTKPNNFGDWLYADGVWRSDNLNEKPDKLDSVAHLECYKSGGQRLVGADAYCMEATAMITGNLPSVDVRYYGVVSWDADRVIASDSPTAPFPICLWTQITINLHDHSIMATDTRKLGKGHEGLNNVCEKIPLAQTYHLLDEAGELTRRSMETSRSKEKNK